jgi:hypothetical protein
MTPDDVIARSVPLEKATHLITGWDAAGVGGGLLSQAPDQVTAYRWAKILRECGDFRDVKVLPNTPEGFEAVHAQIRQWCEAASKKVPKRRSVSIPYLVYDYSRADSRPPGW